MKLLISLVITVCSFSTFAVDCNKTGKKIDNEEIYVEVISRSQFELELVLVAKRDRFHSSFIKVTGGKGYGPTSVPSCESEQVAEIEWVASNIATEMNVDYNSFISTYRVCLYSARKQLQAEYTICNWETGD